MKTLENLDKALAESIELLKDSAFYQKLSIGDNAKAIYARYLEYAFHYVRLSSSFTPLAARRMDEKFVATRKWILEHSAEELGHELMALDDLEVLGRERNTVTNGEVPIGVLAWVSFFHYKVTMDNPFCAFGVLYFLEGMAKQLAPDLLPGIGKALAENERGAVTFFKEHGDLDEDHMAEQQEILQQTEMEPADEQAIERTIRQAGKIKRYMLDQLINEVEG